MKRHSYYLLDKKHEEKALARELLVDIEKPTNENWWFKDLYGLKIRLLYTDDISEHIALRNNPHRVTKEQIGLNNVINIQQAPLEDFNNHINDFNNPHLVTKDQVGLSLIPNEELMSIDDFNKKKESVQDIINIIEGLIDLVYEKNKIPEFTLTVDKKPTDLQVFIFIRGGFVNTDNITKLRFGFYNYQIRYGNLRPIDGTFLMPMEDYTLVCGLDALSLIFNINVDAARAMVYSNGDWIESSNYKFYLMEGHYKYKVVKPHYNTVEGEVDIISKITTVNINMEMTIYDVDIELKTIDYKFKLFIEDNWVSSLKFQLTYGEYDYLLVMPTKEIPGKLLVDHSGIYKIDIELELFNIVINTNPSDAIVEIYINGTYRAGKQFLIPNNDYPITIKAPGYKTINDILDVYKDEVFEFVLELKELVLFINLLTPGSRFFIELDGQWVEGLQFNLFKGSYKVKCECEGYDAYTATIEMVDGDKYLEINLTAVKYDVIFEIDQDNVNILATNIFTNETFIVENNIFKCTLGSYRYFISKPKYKTITGDFEILNEGKTIKHTMELEPFTITIVTYPENTNVFIFNTDTNSWDPSNKVITKTFSTHKIKLVSNEGWIDSQTSEKRNGYNDMEFNIEFDSNKTITKTLVPKMVRVNFLVVNVTDSVIKINGSLDINNTDFAFGSVIDVVISKEGYTDYTNSIIIDSPKEINVTLVKAKCKVNMYTLEDEIIPKIFVNNEWVKARNIEIPSGTYKYKVDFNEFSTLSIYTEEEGTKIYIRYKEEWIELGTIDLPDGEYEYEVEFGNNPNNTNRPTGKLKRFNDISKYKEIEETEIIILEDINMHIPLELKVPNIPEESENMGTINVKTVEPCAIYIRDENNKIYPNNTRLKYGNYDIITKSIKYKEKITPIVLDKELFDDLIDIDQPKYKVTVNTLDNAILKIDGIEVYKDDIYLYKGNYLLEVNVKYYKIKYENIIIENSDIVLDITLVKNKGNIYFINNSENIIKIKQVGTDIIADYSENTEYEYGLYEITLEKEGYENYKDIIELNDILLYHTINLIRKSFIINITSNIDDSIIYLYSNNIGYPNKSSLYYGNKVDYIVFKDGYKPVYGTIDSLLEDKTILVNLEVGTLSNYKVKFNINVEDVNINYYIGDYPIPYENADISELIEGIYVFEFLKEGYRKITKTVIVNQIIEDTIIMETE